MTSKNKCNIQRNNLILTITKEAMMNLFLYLSWTFEDWRWFNPWKLSNFGNWNCWRFFFEFIFLFLFWFKTISFVITVWKSCDASSPRYRKFIYHLDSRNLSSKNCQNRVNKKNRQIVGGISSKLTLTVYRQS